MASQTSERSPSVSSNGRSNRSPSVAIDSTTRPSSTLDTDANDENNGGGQTHSSRSRKFRVNPASVSRPRGESEIGYSDKQVAEREKKQARVNQLLSEPDILKLVPADSCDTCRDNNWPCLLKVHPKGRVSRSCATCGTRSGKNRCTFLRSRNTVIGAETLRVETAKLGALKMELSTSDLAEEEDEEEGEVGEQGVNENVEARTERLEEVRTAFDDFLGDLAETLEGMIEAEGTSEINDSES
ncbi:hypothetical protein P7C73_g3300, partial [Tremellales sp. Uapishka_1]